ncbi:hypothetical protein GCM10023085_26760 [Actinomadura viridis]|uniref:Uncharacterized protein n=1 Tax=Actinomadura viridis TaxID=58110 RepID=A0A931DDU1_9ACTN|nr:hypothetical protein [Actinomadura viridis]MBG6087337.1 hypothetical protein [Actinomadura viridis]
MRPDTPPLRPHRTLATAALTTVRGRSRRPRPVRLSAAALAVPLVHALPPGPDGGSLAGAWFAFDLAPPPGRARYAGVFLRVCFDDPRVTVAGLAAHGERLGIAYDGNGTPRALTEAAGAALDAARACPGLPERLCRRASAEETYANGAGLLFGDVTGRTGAEGPGAGGYAVHAIVRVPPGLARLTGTLRVDAAVTRRGRVEHAHGRDPVPFAVPLPAGRPPDRTAAPAPAEAGARPAAEHSGAVPERDSGVRLCFATDIERFSRFRTPEAARAQRRFVDLLADARRHAGVPATDPQPSGDGQFEVFPAALDESVLIPRLVEGLWEALARTNADLSAHARLRVRAALHRGHVRRGVNGWIGESAIAVHRLLDSARLRRALADHPEADLALIVSDILYRDVIVHGYGRLAPEAFRRVRVRLPDKGFEEEGWIYVPKPA